MTARHAWLVIPSYDGTVELSTMRAVFDDALSLANEDIHVTLVDETGNSMIAHGRDLLLAKFLGDETATDIIFIDNDVAWPKGILPRLMGHPVDIVAAVYPKRADPIVYPVRWISERAELWADPTTGLIEVAGVASGCTRYSRACIEKMVAAYPGQRFADAKAPTGYGWSLFGNLHEGDAYFGEDFSFCERFRRIGGQVWVDPEIDMAHVGKKTFKGNLGDWLRSRFQADFSRETAAERSAAA